MVTAERGLVQHSKTKAEKTRTWTNQVEPGVACGLDTIIIIKARNGV